MSAPLTFLFTDVEGSTRTWEAHPKAMPQALAEQFRLLKEAIEGEGGSIVKETGDGVFAVFTAPLPAVSAAIKAQQALAAASWGVTGPLKARMGVHTGTATREHDDYHGTDVNRTARLMATAHGGQLVVSEVTHALVRDDAPDGLEFVDLGEHRLKDLARPERIYQVNQPSLPTEFPPLRSLGTFPNNLPAALSSFVGRTSELEAVQEALSQSRLVTLTGAGGAGKTRLALQVAADRVERHPDGIWLVDLAGISDPQLVAQAVMSAVRVPEQSGRPALEVLTKYVASRDLLLVLDNCEHLIAAAAELIEALLRASPKIRIIATSREPLNVPGETVWPVPSLTLPQEGDEASAKTSEAVALFVERATAADPSFTLMPERAKVVATMVRRLDGLPLAIELAAARVRALSVEEIAARLNDRFALLTGGARTALPRQRTLEAAVAWSYDLLDEDERLLFARLSVFAGTFDLQAVEAVCSGNGLEEGQILDLLQRLVDKSLVSVLRVGQATRYRLLETLRDYARSQLASSADRQTVRDAHLRWAVAYAAATGSRIIGPEQGRVLEEIAASIDDLRAALDRALEAGDRETGLRIMIGLDAWWSNFATREARHWLEQLLADTESVTPRTLAQGLSLYGLVLAIHGDGDKAVEVQERALALLQEVGDARGVAWATHYLAIGRWKTAAAEEVKRLSLQALALFAEQNEPVGMGRSLWWLILWELEFGTVDEAMKDGASLRELGSRVPGPLLHAHIAEASGLLARVQGDLDQAGQLLQQAVTLHARIRNFGCLSHCLEHVALWSLDRKEPEQAATLLGTVDAIREDIIGNTAVPGFEKMWHERATSSAREALGDEGFADAWGRGRAMSVEEAIAAGMAALSLGVPSAS
jgi:predicted ATPase/class 3 adenylate cyclase